MVRRIIYEFIIKNNKLYILNPTFMNDDTTDPQVHQEAFRLDAVRRYLDLTLTKEKQLQEIAAIAAEICNTPIALITLVDETSQHFIAKVGLDLECTTREESFCAHTIRQDDILMVPDSILDERCAVSPLVTGTPHIRFYAGTPLETFEGFKIGSLCVIDSKPSILSKVQQDALRVLAQQIISAIELRQTLKQLAEQKQIIEDTEAAYQIKAGAIIEQLNQVIKLQSHQIRGPVTSLKGLVHLMKKEHPNVDYEYIHLMNVVVDQMDKEIAEIVRMAHIARS